MSIRYTAGSFNYQNGFVRSILREKIEVGEQVMLINSNKIYNLQNDASTLAKMDIDSSLVYAKNGQWQSIDHALSAMGYQIYVEE
jgi:alcohol dehydrogenase YqhD (iron-dependent ADH family)